MSLEFGKKVHEQAVKLLNQGQDPNLIVKVICDQDPDGHNYGIGIILTGDGKPMATSATLLEYTRKELTVCEEGTYMNSNKILEDVKKAVLKWQRIPEQYASQFKLALPSDAGTGAIKTAVEIALKLNSNIKKLGFQEFGWPAYKTIAESCRISTEEFPEDAVISDQDTFTIYQAGPMNTTGRVVEKERIIERAQTAAKNNKYILLDRAYSGFEFASRLADGGYDEVMQKSYQLQIQPFIENKVPFFLAISPTKAFVTFSLRPCGLLLVFCPDEATDKAMSKLLYAAVRARGSSFEHAITRAFAKALTKDLARLEGEHTMALERVAHAEALWRKLVQGTPMEYLYAEQYAGLFRNPECREDAAVHIYNEHLYPVFGKGRCRQNVTGIPDNEELARQHVRVFAEQCY